MAEYIDKQTVIDTLDGLCDIVCQYSKRVCQYCKKRREFMCGACNLGSAFDVLKELPAADVAPVRHGRWGKKNECSECGCQPWFERDIRSLHYCPNCGARMEKT